MQSLAFKAVPSRTGCFKLRGTRPTVSPRVVHQRHTQTCSQRNPSKRSIPPKDTVRVCPGTRVPLRSDSTLISALWRCPFQLPLKWSVALPGSICPFQLPLKWSVALPGSICSPWPSTQAVSKQAVSSLQGITTLPLGATLNTPHHPHSHHPHSHHPHSHHPHSHHHHSPASLAPHSPCRAAQSLGFYPTSAAASPALTVAAASTILLSTPRNFATAAGAASASSGHMAAAIPVEKIRVGGQGDLVEVTAGPGVTQEDLRAVLSAGPLKQWLDQMEAPNGLLPKHNATAATPSPPVTCRLSHILVQGVDYFGKRPGFVKFRADVFDIATGAKLPGIVFARGGAVGVLMLLKAQDENGHCETYAVLTEQVRVPVGRQLLEMPAGMMDDDGTDFVGTAIREVEEETGIHIKVSEVVDLTALLEQETGQKMLPSAGGCDESITLLLYRAIVDHKLIDSLQGRKTGLQEHGELIRVHVVPLASLWRQSADSKVLAALTLYRNGLEEGLIADEFLCKKE